MDVRVFTFWAFALLVLSVLMLSVLSARLSVSLSLSLSLSLVLSLSLSFSLCVSRLSMCVYVCVCVCMWGVTLNLTERSTGGIVNDTNVIAMQTGGACQCVLVRASAY